MKQTEDLKVFISTGDRDSSCCECGEALGRGAWITLLEGKGALCLACADLDHLTFLPSGNTALTRRARKQSVLPSLAFRYFREIPSRLKTAADCYASVISMGFPLCKPWIKGVGGLILRQLPTLRRSLSGSDQKKLLSLDYHFLLNTS